MQKAFIRHFNMGAILQVSHSEQNMIILLEHHLIFTEVRSCWKTEPVLSDSL